MAVDSSKLYKMRNLNPSRPGPGRREKIKFLFSHFFVVYQSFMKAFMFLFLNDCKGCLFT